MEPQPLITIAGLVGMLALVKTFVDYLRAVASLLRREPGSANRFLLRTIAYVAGLAAVFLYGASQLGDFTIPGTSLLLSDMDGPTKVIVGFSVGAFAMLAKDTLQAIDTSDTQKMPPLVGPPT